METRTQRGDAARARDRANDRLKDLWNAYLCGSLLVATLAHVGAFLWWPETEAQLDRWSVAPAGKPVMSAVAMRGPPAVARPRPPALVVRPPAPPTVEQLEIELGLDDMPVVPPPVLDGPLLEEIAPPVLTHLEEQWLDYEQFAPFIVRPEIRNRSEMKRFLQRYYQPIMEFSGAAGVVQVLFWIDEAGAVERAEVAQSSGFRSLDRLAMRVSEILRFAPALRAGRPVRVLVRLPIVFRAGGAVL